LATLSKVTKKWVRMTLTPTQTVLEIWGQCGEMEKGWGVSSTLFVKIVKQIDEVSRKTPFSLEI